MEGMQTQFHRAIDQRLEPSRFYVNHAILILQNALRQ
jgi:hypothetical protein